MPASAIDLGLVDGEEFSASHVNSIEAAINNLPRGVVGYAHTTSAQTGIVGTEVDVTGLTVTFTADSARRYRTTVIMEVDGTVVNDLIVSYITDGSSNKLQRGIHHVPSLVSGTGYFTLNMSLVETGLSGSTTRKVRIQRNVGTGSISVFSGATWPRSYICVEDLGLA